MSNLTDRLRGEYRIPITDGLGAVGGGEEPDNPDFFVRQFETPPIQKEAADIIDQMEELLDSLLYSSNIPEHFSFEIESMLSTIRHAR